MDENALRPKSDPLLRARLVQESFNYTPSESATTVASSSTKQRDNEADDVSELSRYTYKSGDASQFRREVEGRSFNVLNEAYALPTDEKEWTRLNKQHLAIVLALGGLYPARETVNAILAPEEGETKKILDLGCGTGVWTVAMAREFPHCHVIGVDLAPTPIDVEAVPPNVAFEIDDVNLGLSHYEGKFDVVHARLVSAGLSNFRASKEEMAKCLKPGGLMIWIDADYHMLAQNMTDYISLPSETNPEGSWAARLLFEMSQAVTLSGRSDLDTMRKVLDRGLWKDPLFDPQTCHCASLYLPTTPFINSSNVNLHQRLQYIGSLMRQDYFNGMRGAATLLKMVGHKEEDLDRFLNNMDHELENLTQPTWVRLILAWGRRGSGTGVGPVMQTEAVSSEEPLDMDPYPYMIQYDTLEEALVDANLRDGRRASVKLPPLPPGLM